MDDKYTRNTKYLRENRGRGNKKYKIPEREWKTRMQEIQNT